VVLGYFSRAMRLGETRTKIPAALIDTVYGRDVGRLLDQLGTWKLEGAVGEDLVFVWLEPPEVFRARWAAREAMLAERVRQSVEAPQESGIDRE